MTRTIEFKEVGRFKKSWKADFTFSTRTELDELMLKSIRKSKALMSSDIEINWETERNGNILVGLFRDVGTFNIVSNQ